MKGLTFHWNSPSIKIPQPVKNLQIGPAISTISDIFQYRQTDSQTNILFLPLFIQGYQELHIRSR